MYNLTNQNISPLSKTQHHTNPNDAHYYELLKQDELIKEMKRTIQGIDQFHSRVG
jgi:hypothetical protein